MKKIWILNHYAILPEHGGGTRHYDFARELVKRDYDVTIFASSYNHFTKKEMLAENQTEEMVIREGVRFVWLKTKPYYMNNGLNRILNMISYLIRMLKEYGKYEEPDIVIGSSVHLFACIAAYYISKKTGSKFICEIRDLWPQTLIDMGTINEHHPLAMFFRSIEKFVYQRSDKIITLLPGAYLYINRYNIDDNKIIYIPNGVDIERYNSLSNIGVIKIDRALTNLLDSYFCCIYLGSHGVANCLNVLIDAAKILKERGYANIRFVFIGYGTEKTCLINYCKKNDINNVSFFEPINKDLVPYVLSKGKINLIAMKDIKLYKYGISLNKLFDYMYSAKPVVFSGTVYNNIIDKANAGLVVKPEDPGKVAEAVMRLYNMPERERDELGENGRRYVIENHNISRLVDRFEECF